MWPQDGVYDRVDALSDALFSLFSCESARLELSNGRMDRLKFRQSFKAFLTDVRTFLRVK